MNADCDVLIAGGGMVGASLAVALAALPLRVVVVEAVAMGDPGQPSFDARTTALSRGSHHILTSLGIWPMVAAQAAPIRKIHVSERGRLGTAVIDAADDGGEPLGYVVENRVLGAALWSRLAASPAIDVRAPARVTGVQSAPEAITVTVDRQDGTTPIRTRLLVVADGARSRLRESLGIDARIRSYGQTAIVGNVAVTADDGAMAYERFTPDGPLALLPAGGGRRVFILTRRTAAVDAAFDLPDAEFLALLQQEFGFRLGRFSRLGQRHRYPLELVQAAAITSHRAVMIGNAAHGLHPVAGQGYNLGLRDVATLAELLADQQAGSSTAIADAGDPGLLRRYADWRRPDQKRVVAFTDGLVRGFDLRTPGPLRGMGLLVFDSLPGAKRLLARQTMGLAGRRTRLARGLSL
ncbi:MAG: 2-octaprenyl-6-methoxyphenyl hydroxylase [Gammaproteobacteria bacterium PRO9]|nr:2-octaprenyl-6-methoxyphenyl hydroxylase [Gammaproteobacteria bacterium PRO9]